jgi:aminomethyltransferase
MNPRATPFHSRTSALSRFNRWGIRNGFTLPLDFGNASAEALAARTRVAVGDISWRARAMLEGPSVAEMAARAFTRDPRNLAPGRSLKALWLNDGGAVRGAGVVSRLASDKFLVASAASDLSWFETAASLSGNIVRDVTNEEGGLSLIGPYVANVLTTAGLPNDLAPLELRKQFWRGLDVTITRWGEQDGYELWCKADDCTILWDRIFRAGADFGIQAMGVAASDVLDVEVGVARPSRDYLAANDGFAPDPTPASLSLDKLIDVDHAVFNGRIAWLAARETNESVIVGLELDSEMPAPFCAISAGNKIVGTALTSVYSPALRRALALARIEKFAVKPDASFTIVPQATLENSKPESISAHVRELPFWRPASTVVG